MTLSTLTVECYGRRPISSALLIYARVYRPTHTARDARRRGMDNEVKDILSCVGSARVTCHYQSAPPKN
eukprot:scaffold330707_cov14-Prasinocladus_malaysianus.AAC.1